MANLLYYLPFKSAVERLFNSWTALQLAVEHGMGGHSSKSIALQMIDYVTEYCCVNDNIDIEELTNVLDEIMNEEFDTICEDNSTRELAQLLIKYIQLCRSNLQDQMLLEVSQLPPCKLWLCKPQTQHSPPIQPNEVIHDDSENEFDSVNPQDEPMDEDTEPGWTVVKSKKKN